MPESAPTAHTFPAGLDGRRRVVIDRVQPSVDGGCYPAKRIVGEPVAVAADVLVDGHDKLAGALLYRRRGESGWREAPLEPLENDAWRATFVPDVVGAWEFAVSAWVDGYATWAHGLRRKLDANQDVELELAAGAALFSSAASRARGGAADRLASIAGVLRAPGDMQGRAAA
ncbi:MAG TPA: maltotransferase domain-containing protein, partial [Polyangia bacterium]|nr:maltotransferase domain-containing protein [Polyangia bacterium]